MLDATLESALIILLAFKLVPLIFVVMFASNDEFGVTKVSSKKKCVFIASMNENNDYLNFEIIINNYTHHFPYSYYYYLLHLAYYCYDLVNLMLNPVYRLMAIHILDMTFSNSNLAK